MWDTPAQITTHPHTKPTPIQVTITTYSLRGSVPLDTCEGHQTILKSRLVLDCTTRYMGGTYGSGVFGNTFLDFRVQTRIYATLEFGWDMFAAQVPVIKRVSSRLLDYFEA